MIDKTVNSKSFGPILLMLFEFMHFPSGVYLPIMRDISRHATNFITMTQITYLCNIIVDKSHQLSKSVGVWEISNFLHM